MSEQQLIDCDKRNKGCRGGVMNKAYEYLMNNGMMSAEVMKRLNVDIKKIKQL